MTSGSVSARKGSMSPVMPIAASALFLAVVASPVRQNWRKPPRDGFPLSYYPMFSQKRGATGTVVHLMADMEDGTEMPLHYTVAGEGGFNQVRRQIRKRAATRAGADALAAEVLSRVRSSDASVRRVRVQRSVFSYDDFFAGRREPLRTATLGSCEAES